MGGGHFGQTISAIAKLAPDSVIKEGLEVTYSSYNRNEISAWLEKSLTNQSEPEPTTTPESIATSKPTATPESTVTPEPTATPELTATSKPIATLEPTATPEHKIQVAPKKTVIVRLSAGKKSFTVKWKKQKSQVDGYEITYSISSKFPKKKTKTVTVGKGISSKKISKLKTGKKYYVRIRPYKTIKVQGGKKKLYAGWSKTKTVKVKG